MELTLGSLFDGISGFPLAGARLGIKTLWGSEIEPFPIKVSEIRFPEMKHLGDITKINGAEIEPVDIVTGGSPCQDLSVAGKRAGLAGERSGLFMEQIRVVKEMRERDRKAGNPIRPRFMVWENVPGAFSSNKGEDFRAVLEETARIADETVTIPRPPGGKWDTCGAIMADGYSIAWRILDAQYWRVPQRRRRIFLVADFGGQSAPEILFKREGLSRHLTEGGETRKRVTANAEGGVGKAIPINMQIATRGNRLGERTGFGIGNEGDPAYTIQEAHSHAVAIDSNCQDSRFKLTGQVVPTIPAKAGTGGNNGPMLAVPTNTTDRHAVAIRTANTGANGHGVADDVAHTLDGANGQAVAVINSQPSGKTYQKVTEPLMANSHPGSYTGQDAYTDMLVAKPLSAQPQLRHREDMDNLVCSVDCRNFNETEKHGTLQAKENGGQSLKYMGAVREGYSVRRLTPLECERLQGFPDFWTNIPGTEEVSPQELEFWREVWYTWDKIQSKEPEKVKPRTDKRLSKWLKNPTSDSAQYKALGNSVAVPCAEYVLEGIAEHAFVQNMNFG